MALKYEVNHPTGVPQSAVAGFAPRGLAWHWTAGGSGRTGAQGTVRHFQATRTTVNASYHILFWHEHRAGDACTTVAWEIVPLARAAHSMNPGSAFKPKTGGPGETSRFAEVHRILARDSDPNADSIALSYCGMPAGLAKDLQCRTFRNDLRALAARLIGRASVIERPHFGHGWIQPTTRYEMDQVGLNFIGMLYQASEGAAAPIEQEDEFMLKPRNPIVTQTWDTVPGVEFIRPDGTTGSFTTVERVRSIAEGTVGGKDYRLLDYGRDNEALLMPRAGLTNPGTRIVGSPTGYTKAQLVQARADGIKAAAASAAATK